MREFICKNKFLRMATLAKLRVNNVLRIRCDLQYTCAVEMTDLIPSYLMAADIPAPTIPVLVG